MSVFRDANKFICPGCDRRLDDLWCSNCEFEYYNCSICGDVFDEESDAGDCEYSHRTVLDDIVESIDG